MHPSPFVDPLTYFGLPRSEDFAHSDVAFLGIPYDCARDMIRFGPRQGPNAVRHASIHTRKLLKDAEPFPLDLLSVVDAGNVDVSLESIEDTFACIERAMDAILTNDCLPITVGGDGAVSLPQMRSLHRKYGPIAVLHFDAHTDTWPLPDDRRHTNANQFTFGKLEALVDTSAAWHVGTRGPVNADANVAYARSVGYSVVPFSEYRKWGLDAVLQTLKSSVGAKPVYVCYDMDFFDPSVAPGVATPTPGGAMPEEGIALLRGLKGLNIVGFDINTVTPQHDPAGVTAILAADLLAECLGILCPPA